MKERYRFYREHKFVIAFVNDTGRLIAKTNFCDQKQVEKLKKHIDNLVALLKGHATHEENAFHSLLEKKGSTVHKTIATDHKNHDATFSKWEKLLEEISTLDDANEKSQLGYKFYLNFREFEAENLIHLNIEENIIMPELQKLYSDDELKAVEAETYRKNEMTPDAMIHMMAVLFPYMNEQDYLVFLDDIYQATPDKFEEAFSGIIKAVTTDNKSVLDNNEILRLKEYFLLKEKSQLLNFSNQE